MSTLSSAAGPDLTAAQLHAVLRLRCDVFVVEQECAYPDIDGRDLLPGTRHLWIDGPGGVEAYLRVLTEPGGVSRIGRVVTAKRARGLGRAGELMAAALDGAPGEFVLDAQTYAQKLYSRFGFVAEGQEFLDDGIPHITMRRKD
ncbi:GNAT family N-acetyltransferase [Amycolatopsis sp. PS_44_ISF1]|uniref:GNAT family N-acetyltransferase n=1 Tax=Amycolatopsis sp. PS_44_ISF1 TaxID=2974917 RepID=UPI0028DDAD35|nr:GNAT family N-acetyltransferase [Amycolatopsis sp. PS_44_ISF1]MDT8915414.1 GNAT family N-acetyltransferase [Amycolatopsis sp. PS_44_ISF1]